MPETGIELKVVAKCLWYGLMLCEFLECKSKKGNLNNEAAINIK